MRMRLSNAAVKLQIERPAAVEEAVGVHAEQERKYLGIKFFTHSIVVSGQNGTE